VTEQRTMSWGSEIQPRTAAILAGILLLMMAVIAALSNFAVITNLTVQGDAEATAANLAGSPLLFRLGAVGLLVVAILDVLVAWSLYAVLRPVNPSFSQLGAWLRIVFAAIFAAAINSLFGALRAAPIEPSQTMFFLESFEYGWQAGLIFFGLHLLVVGGLIWRYGSLSWIFAVLLLIAGAGYVVDGLGTLLAPGYSLALSRFTFVGEVVFIFWLLIRGGKGEGARV